MDLRSDSLRCIAVLLFVTLPLFSAVLVSRRHGLGWIAAYVRSLIAYAAGLAMITIGFVVQNSLEWFPQANQYWGGWHIFLEILKFVPSGVYWEEIWICASIIQFVVILSQEPKRVAAAGLRATFLALTVGDIFVGMVVGFSVQDYIVNVFANLMGAIVFAAINTAIIVRLFPEVPVEA